MPIDPLNSTQHSLTALNQATVERSKTLQRLATGRKVNAAADDAAALAAAQAFEAAVRGQQQATTNAQTAVNVVQTAEGGLAQIEGLLQRGRELTVQAANGTLTAEDRAAAQAELNQLTTGIDRIANQTQFNGIPLLNGGQSSPGLTLQIGAGAGDTQNVQISDARAAALDISGLNLETPEGRTAALGALDSALNQVSSQRANLGGIENGLEATVSNLTAGTLNQIGARSRLLDADLAQETTRNTAAAIRQQAAAAVLAQSRANASSVNRLIHGND